jgi:hypothetical protein
MPYQSHFSQLLLGAAFSLALAAGAHADLLGSVKKAADSVAAPASAPTPASTGVASSGLVSMVGEQLGVSNAQATGGLGAIFTVAKQQLSGNQFGEIASAVPGMDGLLSAAPKVESGSKAGGLLSQAGQYGKALQGGSYLNSAFKQLGLSPETIGPFVDIATQYLQTSSPTAANLLKQVAGGL